MKQVKIIYWIIITVWMICVFIVATWIDSDRSLFLSGLAVGISILAIGLSDKFLPKFKGRIKVWVAGYRYTENGKKLSLRIENRADHPVYDVLVKVRSPVDVLSAIDEKNSAIRQYAHGKTAVFVDDSFGILGRDKDSDYLHYDFLFHHDAWTSKEVGYIYITISGTNINTTTFRIRQDQKEKLLAATERSAFKNNADIEVI